MTLELLDGSLISPTSLFDALDTVEEYCGTDLRQYMENFMAGEDVPVEKDEHLQEVLESIEKIAEEIRRDTEQKRLSRKHIQENLYCLFATIRHEIGEKSISGPIQLGISSQIRKSQQKK